jgi:23S rRNA (uracil1939-C5)-methyltransferase
MRPGDRLTLSVEKPAAGGRMIARHDGAIVLVSAAIPGETVDAEVEKIQRGTIWARSLRVVTASADRVTPAGDWACGGNVFSHIAYDRQLALKRDIIRDAFTRIGRMTTPDDLPVTGSTTDGYRMRARLHLRRGRIGFFREGTHELCDVGPTRQLLPETVAAMQRLAAAITALGDAAVAEVEVSENCAADQRAVHLELAEGGEPSRLGVLSAVDGVTGASCGKANSHRALTLWGVPAVTDTIVVPAATGDLPLTLTRHAHAFFQGNRFLLARLVAAVIDAVPDGRALDLYAGVGLFSAALARRGVTVIAIEGDRIAADDLKTNVAVAGGTVEARHQAVETFLAVEKPERIDCVVVDPPRTGMSKEALTAAIALDAPRIVYVSCDVATLGRDARLMVDSGYRLSALQAFDLFPNTAHVESVAVFVRTP